MALEDFTTIIGIGNKSRNGKDTAANFLIEEYAKLYDIKKYGFAIQLKKEVNELDQFEVCLKAGIQYDTTPPMDDPYCQTKHGKQSKLLQWYGQYKREQDPFYWIKALEKVIKEEKPKFAIIADLRYINEMMWIKAHKGYTVKVRREGFIDLSRDPNHISEVQLDDQPFDYEISVPENGQEQLRSDIKEVFSLIQADLTPHAETEFA